MRIEPLRSWSPRALLVVFALVVVACSDDGRMSPTDPGGGLTATPGALVTGDVRRDGHAADGVEVRVDGQPLLARTDASGRFQLDGVATGDRVLVFAAAGAQAPLPIAAVQPGERIEISVALSGSTARLRSISRAAPVPQGALTLEVSPDSWNTNWSRSSGSVTAFFRGGDFALIDPASVVLVGDDPAELPLAPRTARLEGNHVRAAFGKADAFDLLLEPVVSGQTRTLRIDFLNNGVPTSMTAVIRVVGPNR